MKALKKIKTTLFLLTLLMVFVGYSQSENQTEISYEVNNGPVYPIQGTSSQIVGSAHINDKTLNLEKLSFEVPLESFTGIHAEYLAWLGSARYNPNLKFNGNKVVKKGNDYIVSGNIDFRRQISNQDITVTEQQTDNEIILKGSFLFSPRDYFMSPTSFVLVPSIIPMKFTMIFDKSEISTKKS